MKGFKDYVVPFVVVGMIGVMVIPLPSWVLDILLSFNLAFAVLFLVSAIFLQEPARFTALPTVLLLTTVFRLGLNISTTRSVLAGGEIPEIVVAFGDFVVGGNMVVGAVVFSMITLVQFLVIAKGAERVAEVAARFTLDAMPGKQMAIDADLRAGAISLADARNLRRDLQVESKLFGSLDGAMKFVKGDAIAGILITTVNIIAGVFIGCVQHKLTFQAALKKFGIFTIGDGLVSQMPALVIAAAAGIAITRVADQEQPMLGRAIAAQLGGDYRVLLTTSIVLGMLALVPGMPLLPFLFVSALLGFAALVASADTKEEKKKFEIKQSSGLVLGLSQQALMELHKEDRAMDSLNYLRQEHYDKWGVLVPDYQFRLRSELEPNQVVLEFAGVDLEIIKLDLSLDFTKQITEKFAVILEQHCATFINDRHTRMLLEVNQHYLEDTANSIVPEMISITGLTRVLRALVEEGVSIKHLGLIIQALAEFFTEGLFTKTSSLSSIQIEDLLITAARKSLAKQICHSLCMDGKSIEVYRVAEDLDQRLSRYAISNEALPGDLVGEILEKIEAFKTKKPIVFVCSKFSRSVLANIIKNDFRKETVMGSEELLPNLEIKVKGELSLDTKVVSIRKAA